jgi:hypothetical protein
MGPACKWEIAVGPTCQRRQLRGQKRAVKTEQRETIRVEMGTVPELGGRV